MARQVNKLTARTAATLTKPRRHSDGDGLYLNITPTGAKSWVFIYNIAGRRREMGLGALRDVPLSDARALTRAARQHVTAGRDPLAKQRQNTTTTFAQVAKAFLASMSPSWRNAKHRAQWEMTLRVYCAKLADMHVDAITTDDVLRVLKPIWAAKPETASRLRGRIERVLDFAKARGMRAGDNPARWRGHLDAILPRRQKLTRGHHKALAYADVPSFMTQLRAVGSMSARALEFIILTAARSGEVRGARWNEIDLQKRVWTVPAIRHKTSREHRVPLSDRAIEIIAEMQAQRLNDFIFPGQKLGKPLSETALEKAVRRTGADATPHGFRSSFRDWVGDATDFPREVAEAALSHLVGNAVERAYRRGDALEKRRELMAAWSNFCAGPPTAQCCCSFGRLVRPR